MARHNWPAIKAAYIAGSQAADLAREYGVPVSTLESRASREKWGAIRKSIASQVQAELPALVAASQLNEAGIRTCDQLSDAADLRRTMRGLIPKAADATSLAQLSKVARNIQDLERKALGIADARPEPPDAANRADGQPAGVIELPELAPAPVPPDDTDDA